MKWACEKGENFDEKRENFDRKKGEMMEKTEKRNKAGAEFWKRGARAKQDLDTAVITHSLSSLRIGTSVSKRCVFKVTKSMSLPLPWTNAEASAQR